MSDVTFQITETPISVSIGESSLSFDINPATVVFNQPSQELVFQINSAPSLAFSIDGGLLAQTNNNNYSEEEIVYSKRVNFITDSLLYRGEADPGTLTSAPTWRIRRITIAADDDVTEEWADGDASFDNVWDNHLSLTYS